MAFCACAEAWSFDGDDCSFGMVSQSKCLCCSGKLLSELCAEWVCHADVADDLSGV